MKNKKEMTDNARYCSDTYEKKIKKLGRGWRSLVVVGGGGK